MSAVDRPAGAGAPLRLRWRPERLAVARWPAAHALPVLPPGCFFSLTRTDDELSLVVPVAHLPAGAERVEAAWRAAAVVGPLDFSLIGILRGLAAVLAEAGISILAISTHDTDLILVREEHQARAEAALVGAGYRLG